MRLSLLLSALAACTSVLGKSPKTRSPPAKVTRFSNTVFERQLVQATACVQLGINQLRANIAVNLPLLDLPPLVNVGVTQRLCLCTVDGVLTQTSLANIAANLAAQGSVNVQLVGGLVTVDLLDSLSAQALADILGPALLNGLIAAGPVNPSIQCTYGTGAIPNSCTACTYAETPTKCNRNCVPAGTCPSGVPERRRSRNTNLLCPVGLTACGVPNLALSLRASVECVDTSSNVEACGGCEYPLPGMKKGVDCTAIEHTDNVSCVAGLCVVRSCVRGFTLVGGECVLAGLITQA